MSNVSQSEWVEHDNLHLYVYEYIDCYSRIWNQQGQTWTQINWLPALATLWLSASPAVRSAWPSAQNIKDLIITFMI